MVSNLHTLVNFLKDFFFLWLKSHPSLLLRVWLTMASSGWCNGLVPDWQQVISKISDDPVQRCMVDAYLHRQPQWLLDDQLNGHVFCSHKILLWEPTWQSFIIIMGQPDLLLMYSHVRLLFSAFINTLGPRQNGRHFADDIFTCILLNENVWILIKISLSFVPKGPINNIPALVQVMNWTLRKSYKTTGHSFSFSNELHVCN